MQVVASPLSKRCFVQPDAKQGGAPRLEGDEFHAHSHLRMGMGYYTSGRKDVPLINNLNAYNRARRQRMNHVQITTIGAQVGCTGLSSSAGSRLRQLGGRKKWVAGRCTALGFHLHRSPQTQEAEQFQTFRGNGAAAPSRQRHAPHQETYVFSPSSST
jgi:hypothetical protein